MAAWLAVAVLCAAPALAQGLAPAAVDPASAKPGLLAKIGLDQRIGESIPLDLPFTDDAGRQVALREYFGKRPVILVLAYYECPMLCTQVLNGVVSAVGILNFEVGREFDVVVVSFNPKEGPGLAAQKKAAYLERYGRPQSADGWHFLTGTQASIDGLTKAVGFRYAYDERIGQYAHGAGIELLTPKRRAVEVLLRHRVLGARHPARDHRSVQRAHRHADRRRAAALLPLRPRDRHLRRRRAHDGARGRHRHHPGVRRCF